MALRTRKPAFATDTISVSTNSKRWAMRPYTSWLNGGKKLQSVFQRRLPHQVFTFSCGYSDRKIATWVERPWALVRVGKGTSVVFLVKEHALNSTFQAWIVAAEKDANGALRWKRRFETPTTVTQRDLIYVFPISLPYSPSSGDLEYARAEAHARSAP